MAIDRRQGSAGADQTIDCRSVDQQRQQRLLHLEKDPPAILGDPLDEAEELKAIPQSLLGMKQQGAPGQGGSVPEWPVRHPGGQAAHAALPPPPEFAPAARIVPLLQQE